MSGKKAKAKKHLKKMSERRKAKAARAALYQSQAGTSMKRSKIKAANRRRVQWPVVKHAHRVTNCGNPACMCRKAA